MKKFFKVLTSTLLALAMILTGLPWLPTVDLSEVDWDNFSFSNVQLKLGGIAEAFAGSSSTPPPPDRSAKYTDYYGGGNALVNNSATQQTYILEVNMLTCSAGTDPKFVIIKYYDTKDVMHTQYLDLQAGSLYQGTNINASFRAGKAGYVGSSSQTYAPLLANTAYQTAFNANTSTANLLTSGTFYYINGVAVLKNFDQYHTWATALTGASPKTTYKTAAEKTAEKACVTNFGSNYIRFRFQYEFDTLEELSFYCEDVEGSSTANIEFYVDNWALYRHNGEFDENGNFIPGATRLENYAFVSDSVGLSFDGTKLYESDLASDSYMDCIGGGCYVFRNVSQKDNYNMLFSFRDTRGEVGSEMKISDRTILHFGINISTEYGSGMLDGQHVGPIPEVLYADIYYFDKNGRSRAVGIPVVTNALMEYAIPIDEDYNDTNTQIYETGLVTPRTTAITNKELVGFGQDGDTIYFTVEFPSFSEIEYVHLKYVPQSKDSLRIDSIDIFDNGGTYEFSRRDYYRDNSINACAIDLTLQNCTKIYTSQELDNDVEFNEHIDNRDFQFIAASKAKNKKDTFNPVGKYLVTIGTDVTDMAGTMNPIEVYLSYSTVGGEKNSTNIYNLQEAVNEFYGSNVSDVTTEGWVYDTKTGNPKKAADGSNETASVVTKDVDVGNYYYKMQSGGEISFLIDAKNVDKFESITLAFADLERDTDNWQVKHITIQKLQKESVIGKRLVNKVDCTLKEKVNAGQDNYYHIIREYIRPITGLTDYVDKDDLHANLAAHETLKIDLITKVKTAEDEVRNDTEYNYAMGQDIAETIDDLGKAAVNFVVKFKVAGNRDMATRTDDCGSSNLFYVQLLFKSNGGSHSSSGYVLANQQLASDGFRSGYTECFSIAVNEDVGDVIGINIIPEDTSVDSAKFDKLCLSEISVIRQNKNKVNKRFVIETSLVNDGWIGQDYEDKEEKTSNAGRTTAQLEKYFAVSYTTYAVSLEMEFVTGEWELTKEEKEAGETKKFVGAVSMDLRYVAGSSNGETKQSRMGGVQLVEEFATYAKQFDNLQMVNDFNYRLSDPDYMFREGHINRFKVDVDDMRRISQVVLYAHSYAPLGSSDYIPIKSFKVFLITSDVISPVFQETGTNDWMIEYAEERKLIAEWTPSKQMTIDAPANQNTTSGFYQIKFDESTSVDIGSLNDDSNFESVVGRVPESRNDVMNVFVYFPQENNGKTVPTPIDSNVAATTSVSYSNAKNGYTTKVQIASSEMQQKTETYLDGKTYNVMYKLAVPANNMVSVTGLNLQAPLLMKQANKNDYVVSHAVVQQVRAGTVISTYRVNMNNYYGLDNRGASHLGFNDAKTLGFSQKVTFQLGPDSLAATLIPEIFDIACSIVYTSTIAGDEYTYESPFAFASDMDITEVHPGSVLEFDFNEGFVGNIIGVKLTGLNGLNAQTAGIQIRTYASTQTDLGQYSDAELQQFYCINSADIDEGKPLDITKSIAQYNITSAVEPDDVVDSRDLLKRVDITFNTLADEEVTQIDSSGTAPISMILSYQKDTEVVTLEIPDIRKYVSGTNCFEPGTSTTFTYYAEGITGLNNMTIEPYDNEAGSIASMNLRSVVYKVEDVDDTAQHTSMVQRPIYEGDALTVDLSGLIVGAEATYKNSEGEEVTTKSVNDQVNIFVADNTEIKITPSLGADDVYGVTYVQYVEVDGTEMEKTSWASSGSEPITITAENQSQKDKVWIIEIRSSQTPTVRTRFRIIISPEVI